MNEVIHLRIDDAVTADFIRSKAESQHTTPDGYVNSLVRKQVLEEEMNRPLTLITAPELAGRHGELVRDDDETDQEFEDRLRSTESLLSLFP